MCWPDSLGAFQYLIPVIIQFCVDLNFIPNSYGLFSVKSEIVGTWQVNRETGPGFFAEANKKLASIISSEGDSTMIDSTLAKAQDSLKASPVNKPEILAEKKEAGKKTEVKKEEAKCQKV